MQSGAWLSQGAITQRQANALQSCRLRSIQCAEITTMPQMSTILWLAKDCCCPGLAAAQPDLQKAQQSHSPPYLANKTTDMPPPSLTHPPTLTYRNRRTGSQRC